MRKGKSKDMQSPFVKWKKGVKLEGIVNRKFPTTNDGETGMCFEISLRTPMTIEGTKEPRVTINGTKAGIAMSAQACGLELLSDTDGDYFEIGDKLILTAVGETPTKKGNPRLDFELAIDRKD
jgi:hypothetical protein